MMRCGVVVKIVSLVGLLGWVDFCVGGEVLLWECYLC